MTLEQLLNFIRQTVGERKISNFSVDAVDSGWSIVINYEE